MAIGDHSLGRDAAAREVQYWQSTLLALLLITLARLLFLAQDRLDLYPDEAQYWLWSLHPDWGYYSKPPLVAWLIAATTALVGDSEFGIRLAAPLLHLATSLLVYGIARRLHGARIAAWSAVAYATLPGVTASALIISTDAPLMLAWAAALYALIRAREPGGGRWWIAVGVAAGLGLLAKYAMAYWLLSALLFLATGAEERRHLKRFLGATLLALAIYLPNFAWNLANGYVSYLHTRDNADLGGRSFQLKPFFEFAASQFGVFGPLLFAALIVLVVVFPRRLKDPSARLLAWFALPTLAMMLVMGFVSRAHPNWAAPTYISATILVVAFLIERGRAVLVPASIALHVVLAVVLLGAHDVAAAWHLPYPGKYDPLHRLRGWKMLGRVIGDMLAQHPDALLVCDDREDMAALLYYVHPHPFARAVKWNPEGTIHDQFDRSTSLADRVGAEVLFVSRRRALGAVGNYFTEIGPVQHVVLPLGGGAERRYLVNLLGGFKGYR